MSFKLQDHREVTQVETKQDVSLGIMKWGTNNSFPQTLRNLIDQSPAAKAAVNRTIKFYKGSKFEGEDTIISSTGMTLKGLVAILADDYAHFDALGIHSNYNIRGEVATMDPIRITDLRYNEFDELNKSSKLGYHPDFGYNSVVSKTVRNTVTKGKIKWVDKFNPDVVLQQIEKSKDGKISNYNGQILYHSEAGGSSYPIPTLQAPINYVLADIENSILMRKETATGFINSYVLKTMLSSEDPNLDALEKSIEDAQGARGSGKIITMTGLSPEEMEHTVLEEIGSGASASSSVVESCTKGYELCHRVITGAYLIPPILAGADQKTGFSSADLKEAYFVFNAITQTGRDSIESAVNRVLKHSNFPIKEIKLVKLTLDEEQMPVKPVSKGSGKKKLLKKISKLVMGGPGSGRHSEGGGEESQSLGSVSSNDYNEVKTDDKYESYYNGTPEEKTLNSYANRGFQVNYGIRDGTLNSVDEKYISNLNTSLSNLPTHQGGELYRGINLPNDDFNSIEVGSELGFKGFTSTTQDKDRVNEFKGKNPNSSSTPTVFTIVSHNNGKDISQYSNIKSEQEVLFKTDTKWEVISKVGNEITIKEK